MGNACVFIYHEDGQSANILCMDTQDFTDNWITIEKPYASKRGRGWGYGEERNWVVDVGIDMVVCDACYLQGYVEGIGGRKIECPIFLSPPNGTISGVGETLDEAAVDALDNWIYNGTNEGYMLSHRDRVYLFATFFMKKAGPGSKISKSFRKRPGLYDA